MTRTSPASSVTTFEQALAPLGWEAFLSEYWNREYLHLPGYPGKFASLFTWTELNDALQHHRLNQRRLVLYHDGKRLAPERYVVPGNGRLVLDASALTSCLGRGATLVLNWVNELSAATATFAESFDRALGSATRTKVNLYAGWRTQKGFDLHWDGHEVTIVQVAGRKRWVVYRPTVPNPLKGHYPEPRKPTGDPAWEGMLEDGDLLYLPRGWWHVAHPVDEASLHLTLGSPLARGTDLLRWVAEQLLRFPDMRKDVPLWADEAEQRDYLSRLRTLITDAMKGDLLRRFGAARDARIVPRQRFALPAVPQGGTLRLSGDRKVTLTRERRIAVDLLVPGDPAVFRAGGYRWECPPEVVPALESLCDTPRPVQELCDSLGSAPAIAQFRILLGALALKGVVSVE